MATATNGAITGQSGLREYNEDISEFTGMLGGLTPDIHTLRALNPLTTNRVIAVMFRGPYFLQHYFASGGGQNTIDRNAYSRRSPFGVYKKLIEYYNMGIQAPVPAQSLSIQQLQGGHAGRSIPIPTVQEPQGSQTLTFTVPELVGRPVANFHNMWIDGIADPITGLTTYHGLVAGSVDSDGTKLQRIFSPSTGSGLALEPSPAWEVAEFMIIVLDRSGARVEAAVMALGCLPSGKVGMDIFNSNATGSSTLSQVELAYQCQYVQSTYVNDLASRYVAQFAIFGNSLNFNPGAGDAFFNSADADKINTPMFNNGQRPKMDAVQTGVGNMPVFKAGITPVSRERMEQRDLTIPDHSMRHTWDEESGTHQADLIPHPMSGAKEGYPASGITGSPYQEDV